MQPIDLTSPPLPAAVRSEAAGPKELGQQDFLKMLIAQLENQDPLDPQDATEFTAQLAQFNSLDQLMAMRSSMDALTSVQNEAQSLATASLIGREALVSGSQFGVADDPAAAVREAQAIAVGGGNTFRLLELLYEKKLLDPIRHRVNAGIPYVGWSAGSNVACPTIRTTNDMPIAEPPSLKALNLVPFQVNPHFTDAVIPNHGGETRSERLQEFLEANPAMPVLALREGSTLRVEGESWSLLGERAARIFRHGAGPIEVEPGASLEALREVRD